MNERVNEWLNEWRSDWRNEWVNERMCEWNRTKSFSITLTDVTVATFKSAEWRLIEVQIVRF